MGLFEGLENVPPPSWVGVMVVAVATSVVSVITSEAVGGFGALLKRLVLWILRRLFPKRFAVDASAEKEKHAEDLLTEEQKEVLLMADEKGGNVYFHNDKSGVPRVYVGPNIERIIVPGATQKDVYGLKRREYLGDLMTGLPRGHRMRPVLNTYHLTPKGFEAADRLRAGREGEAGKG